MRHAILSLLIGAVGCTTAKEREPDLHEIGIAMQAHRSACTEEYHDGLLMADQIADTNLRQKFLRRLRYDVATQDVWMDNCMYQKEIYNRYGLSLK
jgi:hypothetical protein